MNFKIANRGRITGVAPGLAAGLLVAAAVPAHALQFDYNDIDISLETSLTLGVAARTEDANQEIISKANNANAVAVPGSAPGAFGSNNDDGNLANPDSGDVFFAQAKLSSELAVQWNDWGLFTRANYRYDPNALSDDFFDDFDYGPNRSQSLADKRRREDAAEDAIGNDFELFDAFVYYNFNIAGRNGTIRVGEQVLNWGESTFIGNGINSIIPLDARQARGPGAEVKEVFRPFGMIYGSMALTDSLSIDAFYQYEWEETIPDPSGTFFSTLDVVGAGSAQAVTGFGRCNENIPAGASPLCAAGTNIPETSADTPDDGGQYGLRLNAFLPWLANTDLSLYAINYHSRLPFFGGNGAQTAGAPPSGEFRLVYPEDIELYGFSFNTFSELLGAAVQGEYSYKKDQPLGIDEVEFLLFALGLPGGGLVPDGMGGFTPAPTFQTVGSFTGQGSAGRAGGAAAGQQIFGFIRRDVHQVDISFLKRYGPNWTGANATNVLLEIGAQYVEDLPSTAELPLEGAATYVPNQGDAATALGLPTQDPDGYADDFAWGYRLVLANTYNNVLGRFNLSPSLRFFHDVNGNSPSGISNFQEETKQVSLALSGTYSDAWEAGISYTMFFGGTETAAAPDFTVGQVSSGYENNLLEDRDFANIFVRYTF